MSNLVRMILAEMVTELVATGELLLANGAPERSLHHILRSQRLKGQWPTIFNFSNNKFSQINVCFGPSFFEHEHEMRQKARMLALIGILSNITKGR